MSTFSQFMTGIAFLFAGFWFVVGAATTYFEQQKSEFAVAAPAGEETRPIAGEGFAGYKSPTIYCDTRAPYTVLIQDGTFEGNDVILTGWDRAVTVVNCKIVGGWRTDTDSGAPISYINCERIGSIGQKPERFSGRPLHSTNPNAPPASTGYIWYGTLTAPIEHPVKMIERPIGEQGLFTRKQKR